MKHLFKNGRISPLLGGLFFFVAMLFCSSEASAQFKSSLMDLYGLNVKDPFAGKTIKPDQEAMSALLAQVTVYRNGYASQQGTDNEALHLLRIHYFTNIALAIDNGMGVEAALNKELDATLLPEARQYGTVVNTLALETIYKDAAALVSL